MSKISEIVTSIVDVRVPEGKWKQYLPLLDRERRVYGLNSIKILFALCEIAEEQEKKNTELEERLNALGTIINGLEKEVKHAAKGAKPDTKTSL